MNKANSSHQLQEYVLAIFKKISVPKTYWVSYSGGVDSHLLLHLLASVKKQLSAPLKAVYVDHGLQSASKDWVNDCAAICETLSVPLSIITLNLDKNSKQSTEALAREARYTSISKLIGDDAMLLTGHHGDDQLETMLIQLFRGTGVAGLASMSLIRDLNKGLSNAQLVRPLLGIPQQQILDAANELKLTWVEDKTNQDRAFDRNLLRHEVIPIIKKRWPGILKTTERVANNMAEASELLNDLAQIDLKKHLCNTPYQLDITELKKLSKARQGNLIRLWIKSLDLIPPDHIHLQRILNEVIDARQDAKPEVDWSNTQIRRFSNHLYAMPALENPKNELMRWKGSELHLPPQLGMLKIKEGSYGIDKEQWQAAEVTVGFRVEGIVCTPAGRKGSRSFKSLCQDYGIPPWLRDKVPLIYLDGELTAVGDYFICEGFAARYNNEGIGVFWKRNEFLY